MSSTMPQTEYVRNMVYGRPVAGTPVYVTMSQRLAQPYSEELAAHELAQDRPYLIANAGVTIDNVRLAVVGVGRLTGRYRNATDKTPPMVEVEYGEVYEGNSTSEAMEIVAEMG